MGDHNGNSSGSGGGDGDGGDRNVGGTWSFSGPTASSPGRHRPPACSRSSIARRTAAVQMPFPTSSGAVERRSGGGGRSLEARDCDSEEGAEEPAKPRVGSGSKRTRAAEVHNLSEKRRRSRINEKMKALQNLIPNSNKTDKASMLDEAIEYLKQLQLQVQMLSMRNGLSLHHMYLSGALQPLQASQMCIGFGTDNGAAVSMGAGMLPLNQDSAAQNSFDLSNQSTTSHQSMVMPGVTNISNPENSCGMEPSQSHQGPFQLPVSAEDIFTEDMAAARQQSAGAGGQTTSNLPQNEMKFMAMAALQHFGGQSSSLVDGDNLEECVIGRERPEDMPSKDPGNPIFMQHIHGLEEVFPAPTQRKNHSIFEAHTMALDNALLETKHTDSSVP